MRHARENTVAYSIVVPVFNEESSLPELFARLSGVLAQLDRPAEVLLVDDGSRDGSYAAMREIHERDPRFRVLQFSRNFGHQIAISAGLDHAQGDAVIIIDSDLQDPPELIPEMIAKWREGYEIVYGRRKERSRESLLKRGTAALFYRLLQHITEVPIPVDVGDFRLVDRRVVDVFKKLPERNRYVRGMFSWVGFRQAEVAFRRDARHAGETKYPTRKMIRLAADAVFGFSKFPMRFALKAGVAGSLVSLSVGAALFTAKVAFGQTVNPWYILGALLVFLFCSQVTTVGVLGEYTVRALDEVRERPLYIVAASHGFEESTRKAA
jgi:glycosyltransferase involved in cell wall biosynthesis